MSLDTARAVAVSRSMTHSFMEGFDAAIGEAFHPMLCEMVPSDGADEEYGFIGAHPSVREWLGDRIFHELRAGKFTLVNKQWELSLSVLKNDVADDRLKLLGNYYSGTGRRLALYPDKELFSLIVAGEATVCWDGQYFYDTDHSWGSSGSQSNDLGASASNTAAVTASEFKTAYNAAVAALLRFVDDAGEKIHQGAISRLSDLMIVVPPQLRQVAHEAVQATIISNTTNVELDQPQIRTSALLTSGTKWYLNYLGDMLKPFVFQDREAFSVGTKGEDDRESKHIKFMGDGRFNVGYLAWWNSVLTTFS